MNKRVKNWSSVLGKTVRMVDSYMNFVEIFFTDDTSIALEVENVGSGLHGIIIQREEVNAEQR
jgi:hypothetical protein